jgi:uncharacterized protein
VDFAPFPKKILSEVNFPKDKLPIVLDAILSHSFSAKLITKRHDGKIFQDADRLDALGAIGIARAFATGAIFNSSLYCINDPFAKHGRILNDKKHTLDHFFVKLFKIPTIMFTKTGKRIAEKRILFMKAFIQNLEEEICED